MLPALEELRQMGADQTAILYISNLIKNAGLSSEAAMDLLGATEHDRELYWDEVRKQRMNNDGTHPGSSVP